MKLAPALLNERQAAELLGVSTRKFHALRNEAWFPLAVELGPRALRWYAEELLQAVANRAPRRTVQAEPAHLARVRAERAAVPEHLGDAVAPRRS
jgi:predicted DNA-binding transcriptional regulator AlpA